MGLAGAARDAVGPAGVRAGRRAVALGPLPGGDLRADDVRAPGLRGPPGAGRAGRHGARVAYRSDGHDRRPTRVTDRLSGVYAMPVLPSFFVSHQWLRELRRLGTTPLVAIDFVIADSEEVRAGHFSQQHATMTATEATGVIMHADDPRGYEVLIPRKIQPKDLRRTRQEPQVIGWRYWPDAHGQEPCDCEVCQRGTFKAAQFRDRDGLRLEARGAARVAAPRPLLQAMSSVWRRCVGLTARFPGPLQGKLGRRSVGVEQEQREGARACSSGSACSERFRSV